MHCEGLYLVNVNIFIRNMCLANYGASRQFILVTWWRKSTSTLDLKCANVFRE
jgi:hypothetical protein